MHGPLDVKELVDYYLTSRNFLCKVTTASGLHIIGQMLTMSGLINVQIQCQIRSQLSRVFAKQVKH
jgi:hypothetical protein